MRPKIRLLLIALGVLVTAFVPVPRASAATTMTFTFGGSLTIAGSLGMPCTALDEPCPPSTTTSPKTDGFGLAVTNVTTDGPTRAMGWGVFFCEDSGANVEKAAKFPVLAGACSFPGSGAITGYCTLATGSGTASFTDSLGQSYSIVWKLTWTGQTPDVATITMTGTITKHASGKSGAFRATMTAQLTSGACIDRTGYNWTILGEGAIRILN